VKDKNLGAQFSDKNYGEKARAANNIRRVNLMVNAASQDDKMVIKYELCALCVVHVVSYYWDWTQYLKQCTIATNIVANNITYSQKQSKGQQEDQ